MWSAAPIQQAACRLFGQPYHRVVGKGIQEARSYEGLVEAMPVVLNVLVAIVVVGARCTQPIIPKKFPHRVIKHRVGTPLHRATPPARYRSRHHCVKTSSRDHPWVKGAGIEITKQKRSRVAYARFYRPDHPR